MMALMLFCVTHVDAQQRDKYEFMRNLPVYADSLIADLDYPLAWGHSDIQDFNADDKLETQIWGMPHSCPVKAQEKVLEFFRKHL